VVTIADSNLVKHMYVDVHFSLVLFYLYAVIRLMLELFCWLRRLDIHFFRYSD
jgi:hypothetical protein